MSEEKEVTRAELEALMLRSLKDVSLMAPSWADVARLLLESIQEREKEAKKHPRAIGAPQVVPRDP